jgi:hypothetical protein
MSSAVAPFIGIDFGTSKSVMARYVAEAGQAQIIYNQEGRPETPSVVYLGRDDSDIVVGEPAEMMLDAVQIDQSRFVVSVKRDLLSAAPKVLDGRRIYKPVDIAAKILGKLKDDAERLSFQRMPVRRVVITYPASFNPLQQDKIKQAAILAGFEEVMLLPEPVAAAIACSRSNLRVGKYILVYDFGAGTFDVAVLASNASTTGYLPFELALPSRGLSHCGGDDLDRKLYDYCEEIAQQTLHRPISLTNDIDLKFLHECRKRKENLSSSASTRFSSFLIASGSAVIFEHTLQRAIFEERIREYIDRTVELTKDVVTEAIGRRCQVDTTILIGGSSRIPLAMRTLAMSLPMRPEEWEQRDFAVALGAAYYAQHLWGSKRSYTPPPPPPPPDTQLYHAPAPPPPPAPSRSEQYRHALLDRWGATRKLTRAQVGELVSLANSLGLSTERVASIEYQMMGNTKENILKMQEAAQYNRVLEQSRTGAAFSQTGPVPNPVPMPVQRSGSGSGSKVAGIILLIVALVFCLAGLGSGSGGGGTFVLGLIMLIVSIILLVRKSNKGKAQMPPPAMKR